MKSLVAVVILTCIVIAGLVLFLVPRFQEKSALEKYIKFIGDHTDFHKNTSDISSSKKEIYSLEKHLEYGTITKRDLDEIATRFRVTFLSHPYDPRTFKFPIRFPCWRVQGRYYTGEVYYDGAFRILDASEENERTKGLYSETYLFPNTAEQDAAANP